MNYEAIAEVVGNIDLIFLLIGAAILLIEIVEMLVKGTFKRRALFEMGSSLSTQIPSIVVETALVTTGYALYYIIAEAAVSWSIPPT